MKGISDRGIPIETIDQMRAACMNPENGCQIIDAFDGWKRVLAWFRENGVG